MGCEFAPTKPQSYSILTSEEKMTKKYSSIHPELQSIAK